MKGWKLFEDWLLIPKEELVIESEFETEFIQKCLRIRLKKAVEDEEFIKDIQKIKIGYFKISQEARTRIKELGFLNKCD
jgi:hypothetical protein